MNTKQRIYIGAIGGITPYLITLLSIDFKIVVGSYELLDWFGLVVRCIVLIFLGSLVAYLHKTETEQFKVFQLGLAAPALLAAIINGNVGNNQTLPSPTQSNETVSISLFSQAYAIEAENEYINSGMLKSAKVSPLSRFLRGVFGTKLKTSEKEAYFVIVGSHEEKQNAQKQVDLLAGMAYEAQIYRPYGISKHYAVVIASNVTFGEASAVKEEAIQNGLPNDSYVWTY